MAFFTLLLIALRVAFALAQISTSTESPTSTDVPDRTDTSGDVHAEYKLRGYEGCSASQIDAIKSGFAEMVIMVGGKGGIIRSYPKVDWNSAVAQDFWGPAERNRLYRDLIQDNLDRLASVTYDWYINPFASAIRVRCDGYDDEGREFCDSGKCSGPNSVVTAFTIKHQPHINFCPGYFTRKTLAEATMGGDWVSAGAYFNQASVWAHELMHVKAIGRVVDGSPEEGIDDQLVKNWPSQNGAKAYGPLHTKWLAQDPSGNYREVVENADNYAYFVTLNYMQRTLGYYLSDPQIQISPQTYQNVLANNVTVESQTENGGDDRCLWA